jgi:hypothetical protein
MHKCFFLDFHPIFVHSHEALIVRIGTENINQASLSFFARFGSFDNFVFYLI